MKKFTTFLLPAILFALTLFPNIRVHAQKSKDMKVDSIRLLVAVDDSLTNVFLTVLMLTRDMCELDKEYESLKRITDSLDRELKVGLTEEIVNLYEVTVNKEKIVALKLGLLAKKMQSNKEMIIPLYTRRAQLIVYLTDERLN